MTLHPKIQSKTSLSTINPPTLELTTDSVILYCPKSRRGKNHSGTIYLSRSDKHQYHLSCIANDISKAMSSAYNRLKMERSWFSGIKSQDIDEGCQKDLETIFQNSLHQDSYGRFNERGISIFKIPNEHYDSLIRLKEALNHEDRKGIVVIPTETSSVYHQGSMAKYGIASYNTITREKDRISMLRRLSEYSKFLAESTNLDDTTRSKERSKGFEDCGYVYLDDSEIKMFSGIMEELPSYE
ncbi:uncharacterized protein L199_006979 [Kwoniella botswanensis]|uniref:uncharacterized protein n=1 Tax=Kwoniella botswanensis TaxID=1268659 RepID=UPI00315DBC4B